jgi:glycine hydroxymethyltransferase
VTNLVDSYIKDRSPESVDTDFLVYLANLSKVAEVSPKIAQAIVQELADQRSNLKLIASENYTSVASQAAMANLLTDKYAEGYPHHRFYAGCDNVDAVEEHAAVEAMKLFGCEHAYVQPHSGADANLMAYWAILHTRVEIPYLEKLGEMNPSKLEEADWSELRKLSGNQRLLGMDYYSGGHLTHGYRHNISARMFEAYSYGVSKRTGLIDYDELEKMVKEIEPLILLTGYSAYPRLIDFERMRKIADTVNAVLMVDMAHFGGLVAGKALTGVYDPVPYAHVITATTHKTLRGPRGGLILCTEEFREAVNKGCPLVIGGPLPHILAAKAVAMTEANTPEYREYAKRIIENAKGLADSLMKRGIELITSGTDNHLMLIDVRPFGLNGRQAESAMRECGITLNRNSIPYDPNGPWYTSGLRIGTPAVTTLGMGTREMDDIADILTTVINHTRSLSRNGKKSSKYTLDEGVREKARRRVQSLLDRFPVYPGIDLEYLRKAL